MVKELCQSFYWTARLIENGEIVESKYFSTQKERDHFVLKNPKWCKRGKICKQNLEKHLQDKKNTNTIN